MGRAPDLPGRYSSCRHAPGLAIVIEVIARPGEFPFLELMPVFRPPEPPAITRENIEQALAPLPIFACSLIRRIAARGFGEDVIREYLTRHIVHELSERDYRGMDLFLNYARQEAAAPVLPVTSV